MKPQIEVKSFQRPDECLDFHEHGKIQVIKLSDGTTGMLATLKPGWTWEVDEKPLIGNPATCPMPHTGYCVSGEVVVRIVDTQQEVRIRQGDFFAIPEGHVAHVAGNETCQLILFQPLEEAVQQLAA